MLLSDLAISNVTEQVAHVYHAMDELDAISAKSVILRDTIQSILNLDLSSVQHNILAVHDHLEEISYIASHSLQVMSYLSPDIRD